LDWGEQAETIRLAASEGGREIPDLPFLVNKPELAEHLEFEWRAFLDLRRDRSNGFELGRIPWSSIDRYAQRYRIDDLDEFERFARLISAMDDADREHHQQMTPPPNHPPK
jgi:hypothetical protein